ncbi:hypothetical protein H4R99_003920 [Coemansia sp. RSA 1722]|nr:hypothetical protein H4R99_003920 [Coemansia sp. RSA 1722]KAJ2600335.1 hypothetical protein GGF39_001833 [Coemansia sp. RSA 1721]KAJ2635396.1 hypothetical protein GGF40_003640 [Coemansia sp. RSA 1286]
MGQAASRTVKTSKHLRLPRTSPGASPSSTPTQTREQMLSEDPASSQDSDDAKVSDNLKYFLNPKELLTPITPKNPRENTNVQALMHRREDDDVQVSGVANRLPAQDIRRMLVEYGSGSVDSAQVAGKYQVDQRVLGKLDLYLAPAFRSSSQ